MSKELNKNDGFKLTKDDLVEIFKAARAPDPEEQARLDLEKARLKKRREALITRAKQLDLATLQRQMNCRHSKPNGEEASGGQVLSSGYDVRICLRCQKILYFKPSQAMSQAADEIAKLIKEGRAKIVNGELKITEVPMPRS